MRLAASLWSDREEIMQPKIGTDAPADRWIGAVELAIVQKAFDRLCAERGLSRDCTEARELARVTIDLYRQGADSEYKLHTSLSGSDFKTPAL
jgi:hypothetical protein